MTTGYIPGSLAQFAVGAGGALTPLSPAMVDAAQAPTNVTVSPDGRSVYVANREAVTPQQGVTQYDVDPLTGKLSPKTPATVWSPSAFDIAVSPDGKSAYVASQGDGVSQYDIDPSSGTLSPKDPFQVAGGTGTYALVVNPDGNSVYAVNQGGNSVSQYTIDPVDGSLSPKTPSEVALGGDPNMAFGAFGIGVTPDGRSVYATNAGNHTISQFDVDPSTGALTPKAPAIVAAGSFPFEITVSPDGRSAYATDEGLEAVLQYDIDASSGTLSPKAPPSVPAPTASGIAVSLDGTSVYVSNLGHETGPDTVTQYNVDPATGALSPKTPATVAAGDGPGGIAVGPLPVEPSSPSTRTSVSCSTNPVVFDNPTTCTATVTNWAGAANAAPTGSISFASGGPGGFTSSPCALSGSGASASCQATYTPSATGSNSARADTITATYSGDASHTGSQGFTRVKTVPPVIGDHDRYGDALAFVDADLSDAPCNPSFAALDVANLKVGSVTSDQPLFGTGLAWVDYFGIPVSVSPAFRVMPAPDILVYTPVPSASKLPAGRYTMHVLLQGNGQVFSPLYLAFTTLGDRATIDRRLNPDCSPIAATASAAASTAARPIVRMPSRRVLERRVRAARRSSRKWFGRSPGPRARYPKARFCGQSICVKRRAGARWMRISRVLKHH